MKINYTKLTAIVICVLFLPCISFAQTKTAQQKLKQNGVQSLVVDSSLQKANITYTIIPSKNNTWGYDIYVNGKLRIHQLTIPAMPGNEGFASKKSAGKVAEKVIGKMKKGESLPTITIEELKALKVI